MSVRVRATTTGQSSPASVAEDAGRTGGYKYRGDPDWTPGDARYRAGPPRSEPLPQNVKATAGKRERFARYARLRLEGASKEDAARGAGISSTSTVHHYEREYKARVAAGMPMELGPALSDPCDRGECETCPDGPGDCGCGHHDDEGRQP